jgi:ribosomal protein L40E
MLALVLGTLLAVGALAYVLYPLMMDPVFAPRPTRMTGITPTDVGEGEAVAALREIEFDRATGKLSDADYAELKSRYTERALEAMRRAAAPAAADEIEAAVSAYRARMKSCVRCGPRPEPDAEYCSSCGLFLAGTCATCGARVTEPGAAYCTSCGHQLAA